MIKFSGDCDWESFISLFSFYGMVLQKKKEIIFCKGTRSTKHLSDGRATCSPFIQNSLFRLMSFELGLKKMVRQVYRPLYTYFFHFILTLKSSSLLKIYTHFSLFTMYIQGIIHYQLKTHITYNQHIYNPPLIGGLLHRPWPWVFWKVKTIVAGYKTLCRFFFHVISCYERRH